LPILDNIILTIRQNKNKKDFHKAPNVHLIVQMTTPLAMVISPNCLDKGRVSSGTVHFGIFGANPKKFPKQQH